MPVDGVELIDFLEDLFVELYKFNVATILGYFDFSLLSLDSRNHIVYHFYRKLNPPPL